MPRTYENNISTLDDLLDFVFIPHFSLDDLTSLFLELLSRGLTGIPGDGSDTIRVRGRDEMVDDGAALGACCAENGDEWCGRVSGSDHVCLLMLDVFKFL